MRLSQSNAAFSFLDESRNTELIRWSQNGDSFIVLDEEEFARTLIPELFKHANYASFVRQLNMYGFHKQVGLSDNSMRASERKNKSPSEYKNPYFRRGKPTWMWLIQKPKSTQSKGKGGRGKQEEGNDEEENYDVENPGVSNISSEDKGTTLRSSKPPLMIGQGENSLAQEELAALHQELRTIRQQHQAIAGVIQKIRRDHDQIFQQAQAFQDLHSRHENSINAILTFLATVYNRSLEGHGGTQNIGNMFAGSIPHDMPQQGSVVDVGELSDQTLGPSGSLNRRPVRRQPLLLQAPPNSSRSGGGRVIGTPSTPQTVDTPPNQDQYSYPHDQSPAPSHPVVEELPDQEYNHVPRGTPQQVTSNNNSSTNLGLPERDIMSFINSANANEHNASATSQMDFGEALSHLQNRDGKGPLSPSERNGMLQMIANGSNQGPSSGSNDNALTSPNPPTAPVPNFDNWQASNDDIALLQKSMQETDSKLTNISNRLSPISPNGSIPGFEQGGYLPPPNDPLDFDQIFNSGDYFNDASNGNLDFGDESAFDGNSNFNFDDPTGTNSTNGYGANVDEEQGGRVLETVNSSEATSPANTVEDEVVAPPPPKRQRG